MKSDKRRWCSRGIGGEREDSEHPQTFSVHDNQTIGSLVPSMRRKRNVYDVKIHCLSRPRSHDLKCTF